MFTVNALTFTVIITDHIKLKMLFNLGEKNMLIDKNLLLLMT